MKIRDKLIDKEGDIIVEPEEAKTDAQVVMDNNDQEIYRPEDRSLDFRKL